MRAYFITATGTDIGKTFVTCALVYGAPRLRAFKPVISGFTGNATDTHCLIEAMGGGDVAQVSPWRYAAPLSPNMAAEQEGAALPYESLLAWTQERAKEPCLIEAVGGAMVPLDATHTVRDWMLAAGMPVIVVAGSYLGSISHTLTTLEVLKAAGITVRALVVSESENSTVPLDSTAKTLAQHTDALIVVQPRVSSYREAYAIHALAKELL